MYDMCVCVFGLTRSLSPPPSHAYNRLRSPLTACLKKLLFLTVCRQETKAKCPLLPTGPYRLEGTTLADRLATSPHYKHLSLLPL